MAPATRTGTEWLRTQARRVTDGGPLPVTAPVAASTQVEQWLQRHGVRYAPPAMIPLTLVDVKRSRGNQARRDAIVADSVDRFAAAMRAGTAFPPIVVYPVGGVVVIIDGNNRDAAARKAGRDAQPGIVIAADTPSELIQLLTVEANARHGVTPELSWRVQQAFHLTALGFTDPQAAEAAAISVTQLRAARAAAEADHRAHALRIVGFPDLAQNSRQSLGALKDQAVFYQAAKLAVDTAMTVEEIRDLVREVKTLPSEEARIEHIGALATTRGTERAARKAAGHPTRISSPRQTLVTGIGKVLAVDDATLVRQILTTHDRDQISTRLKALKRKIIQLELALGTLGELEEA